MNIKRSLYVLLLLFIYTSTTAQRWMQSPYLKSKPDSLGNYNFYAIQKAFQLYEKKFDRKNKFEDEEKD